MNLIIIGNGFDVHHGLETGYKNYHNYLRNSEPYILKKYEGFPWHNKECKNNLWSDVEKTLSYDFESMNTYLLQYIIDYEKGDKNALNELYVDLDDWTRFIYSFTGESFYKWLSLVEIQNKVPDENIQNVFQDSVIITFNYTNTLELIYNIPLEKILHIHGKFTDVQAEACLSHTIIPHFDTIEDAESSADEAIEKDKWNSDIIREIIQFGAPCINKDESDSLEVYKRIDDVVIKEMLSEFMDKSVKKPYKNIKKITDFLNEKNITSVYIMGLSLDGADDYYFDKVFIPQYKNCEWNFYYYDNDDLNRKKMFAQKYGIKNAIYISW